VIVVVAVPAHRLEVRFGQKGERDAEILLVALVEMLLFVLPFLFRDVVQVHVHPQVLVRFDLDPSSFDGHVECCTRAVSSVVGMAKFSGKDLSLTFNFWVLEVEPVELRRVVVPFALAKALRWQIKTGASAFETWDAFVIGNAGT